MKGKISQQTHACPRALCAIYEYNLQKSTGVCVRDTQNETRLILNLLVWEITPYTQVYTCVCTQTHTVTHTYIYLLEQSSYSHCLHPRKEPGAMEVAETASHLQMFFFSQKSCSLISVLSKTYDTTPLL